MMIFAKTAQNIVRKNNMTEEEVKTYILNTIDNIYQDVKGMTSGNISHRQGCLLHDIYALKNNILFFIKQNTNYLKENGK